MVTHPRSNFNGCLVKPPLIWMRNYILYKLWMQLDIHIIILADIYESNTMTTVPAKGYISVQQIIMFPSKIWLNSGKMIFKIPDSDQYIYIYNEWYKNTLLSSLFEKKVAVIMGSLFCARCKGECRPNNDSGTDHCPQNKLQQKFTVRGDETQLHRVRGSVSGSYRNTGLTRAVLWIMRKPPWLWTMCCLFISLTRWSCAPDLCVCVSVCVSVVVCTYVCQITL